MNSSKDGGKRGTGARVALERTRVSERGGARELMPCQTTLVNVKGPVVPVKII